MGLSCAGAANRWPAVAVRQRGLSGTRRWALAVTPPRGSSLHMTHSMNATEVRDAYLLPYSSNTLLTDTYQLDRWLAWCSTNSIEPLTARRTDVETYIRYLHAEVNHKISTVHTAL